MTIYTVMVCYGPPGERKVDCFPAGEWENAHRRYETLAIAPEFGGGVTMWLYRDYVEGPRDGVQIGGPGP